MFNQIHPCLPIYSFICMDQAKTHKDTHREGQIQTYKHTHTHKNKDKEEKEDTQVSLPNPYNNNDNVPKLPKYF